MTQINKSKIAELQRSRGKSRLDFFNYQYEGAKGDLEQMRKFVQVNDKDILDLGCGYGGSSSYLANSGLRVTSVDIQQYDKDFLRDAIKFANKKKAKAKFCQADAHYLPFKTGTFDIIKLDSVLEHLTEPELALSECRRVLKSGGLLFISFPLFYSPYGGHIDDYIRFPWAHVLPQSWVCWLINKCRTRSGLVTTDYTERLYLSLNKMTLTKYKKIIDHLNFKEISFEEAFFMPHDATLFINGLKSSFANKSLKPLKESFPYFNIISLLIFTFLFILYRLPSPLRRKWQEFIISGIRSVLSTQ